jgi:uncharacterized peroxidase-related enzyme
MFVLPPENSPATDKLYESFEKSNGFVMNLSRAWAWRPDVFEGFGALRSQLTSASSLSKRDQAVIVCATASELRDAYCSLAWGRTLASEAGAAAAAAILLGQPDDALTDRDLALAAWARKLVADPNSTTEADVAALRAAGFGDREIVEITIFAAFRLAFSTVNDALGISPDAELRATVPPAVGAAVSYGRSSALRGGAPA